VIGRPDHIERPLSLAVEDGIAGKTARQAGQLGSQAVERRVEHLSLLRAEQPTLTGMRVQPTDTDAGLLGTESPGQRKCAAHRFFQTSRVEGPGHVAQWKMPGRQKHAQRFTNEGHAGLSAPRMREKLCLTGKGEADLLQAMLTDRPCHNAAKAPATATFGDRFHGGKRQRRTPGRRLPRLRHKVIRTDGLINQTQGLL